MAADIVAPGPVIVECGYPERLSRLKLLLKSFLGFLYVGIPHGIILYVLNILSNVASFIAFFAILITGKHPRGLFDFVVGVRRWQLRVFAYWVALLTDDYPPFNMNADANTIRLEVTYPEKLSRWHLLAKVFFGWLYVGIPHGIILLVYGIAALVALFIAWWSVLLVGRYPRALFNFVVGYARWQERVMAYLVFLRDDYPKFSARP